MKSTPKKSIVLVFAVLSLINTLIAQTSWNTNGNTGSYSNFIGTTNNYPFLFRTNNVERFRIQPNGFVGIGVANPSQRLDVYGNLRVRGNVYVDQNVFQQGQFDADSIDAGLISTSSLSANKISTDTLNAYVFVMDQLSKFVGTAHFEEYLMANQGIVVGQETDGATIPGPPSDPSLKFEVRGGDSKFDGNVDVIGNLKLGNLSNADFNFLTVGEDGELISQSRNELKDQMWKPELVAECAGTAGSNYQQSVTARWLSGTTHTFTCWPVNIGGNSYPEFPLNVNGSINTNGGDFLINGVPIRQGVWDNADNGNIKYTIGNVGIGTNNPTEKLDVNGGLKVSGNTFLSRLIVNTTSNQYNANAKLAVTGLSIFEGNIITLGDITSKKIKVCADGWCDYVFEKEYKLTPLKEVEKFIAKNKHLPDVPSAKEIENQEVDIFEMQKIQMQKIEELTLYLIELKKENEEMKLILNTKK